jgi:tape measure domain-containing protein
MAEKKISVALEGKMDNLSRTLQQAERETEKTARGMSESFGRADSGILSIGRSMSTFALGAVGATASVSLLAREIVTASLASEKLTLLFKAASGSNGAAASELEFIRKESERLGLSLPIAAGAYGKFMAATRNTSIEGEAARKVFVGVSEAATALGLSGEESQGIFLALSQMMSKGKVSAEELTGQLGERLPGALKLAADAMGMTTFQLLKQMQDGKIMSAELLPKLAEQLHQTYGDSATEAAKKGQAGINRFKNEIFQTAAALSEVLMPSINRAGEAMSELLKEAREGKWGFKPENLAFLLPDAGWEPEKQTPARNSREVMDATEKRFKQDEINRKRAADEKKALAAMNAKKESGPKGNESVKFWGGFADEEGEKAEIAYMKQRSAALKEMLLAQIDEMRLTDEWLNTKNEMSKSQQERFGKSAMVTTWAARNLASNQAADQAGARITGSPEMAQLQAEEDAAIQSWAMMTDSFEVYEQRKTMIEEIYTGKRIALKKAEEQKKYAMVAAGAGQVGDVALQLHNVLGKRDKVAFRAFQAAKSGETVISTASGIMKAWADVDSFTFVERAAKAAFIGAQGAVQLAAIWSASPDGGGSGSGGSAGNVTAPGGMYNPVVTQPTTTTAAQQQGHVTVQIMGNLIGEDKWVEESLIPAIKSAGSRGVTLIT